MRELDPWEVEDERQKKVKPLRMLSFVVALIVIGYSLLGSAWLRGILHTVIMALNNQPHP